MEDIINEIKNDKLIQKYLYQHIWTSGSSTLVYPVEIWRNKDETIREIIIQIDTKRDYFKKLIKRYEEKYKEIEYSYFDKTDDSCPSRLVFKFKGWWK